MIKVAPGYCGKNIQFTAIIVYVTHLVPLSFLFFESGPWFYRKWS